jgi:hypothetical protein
MYMYLASVGRVRVWAYEQLKCHVYRDSMRWRHLVGRNAQTASDAQLQNVALLVANILNTNRDN